MQTSTHLMLLLFCFHFFCRVIFFCSVCNLTEHMYFSCYSVINVNFNLPPSLPCFNYKYLLFVYFYVFCYRRDQQYDLVNWMKTRLWSG